MKKPIHFNLLWKSFISAISTGESNVDILVTVILAFFIGLPISMFIVLIIKLIFINGLILFCVKSLHISNIFVDHGCLNYDLHFDSMFLTSGLSQDCNLVAAISSVILIQFVVLIFSGYFLYHKTKQIYQKLTSVHEV